MNPNTKLLKAVDRLRVTAVEFCNDWKKGDFDLPPLAAIDAEALRDACIDFESARKTFLKSPPIKP